MKVAFDIGGVLSKFPNLFREMVLILMRGGAEVFIITDMHKRDEVLQMLRDNDFGVIPEANVYSADYTNHGEFCKAILLKQLKIDIFFDDFVGYVQWDSKLGDAPVRCLLAPDGFKPYWADSWTVPTNHDFGRRVTSLEALEKVAKECQTQSS